MYVYIGRIDITTKKDPVENKHNERKQFQGRSY